MMLSWKMAACLAAGNTVVIKPAQVGLVCSRQGHWSLEEETGAPFGPLPAQDWYLLKRGRVLLTRAGLPWALLTAAEAARSRGQCGL